MTYASRDTFFDSMERRYRDVKTRYGLYRIQSLTCLERDSCENSLLNEDGEMEADYRLQIKPKYIIAAVVDEDGKRMFTESHLKQIQACDADLTNALADAILDHCGISEKDVDDAEKNLEATGENNSPTNSPQELVGST